MPHGFLPVRSRTGYPQPHWPSLVPVSTRALFHTLQAEYIGRNGYALPLLVTGLHHNGSLLHASDLHAKQPSRPVHLSRIAPPSRNVHLRVITLLKHDNCVA